MEVITIWFAVTSSTIKNGCVKVIPRSQKLGPISHHTKTDTVNLLNSEVDPSVVDESQAVSVELNAGDISVHHPLVLHGSTANNSDRWRRGGSIQYMPVTTRIISKNWPCAFLLQGEDVAGVNNYQPKPKYIVGQHMPFQGCEDF
jgi:ectoine hydroxylase-related dioxygenase (phytanoyl-CoA dioxygenase family)